MPFKSRASSFLVLLMLLVTSVSCNLTSSDSQESSVWVFVEVADSDTDTTEYYRYGKINNRILEKINANENATGLFLITHLRYINLNDKLVLDEDSENSGKTYYRLQDIIHLELLKEDPIYT